MKRYVRFTYLAVALCLGIPSVAWACGGGSGSNMASAASALTASSNLTTFLNDLLSSGTSVTARVLGNVAGTFNGFLFTLADFTLQPGAPTEFNQGVSYLSEVAKTGDLLAPEAQRAGMSIQDLNELEGSPR